MLDFEGIFLKGYFFDKISIDEYKNKSILYDFFTNYTPNKKNNYSSTDVLLPLKKFIHNYFYNVVNSNHFKILKINENIFIKHFSNQVFRFIIYDFCFNTLQYEFNKLKVNSVDFDSKQFVEYTNNIEWIEYYFEEYPVLYCKIDMFLNCQTLYLQEILYNLDKDFNILKQDFKINNPLSSVNHFLGDFHNNNKCSLILYFGNIKLLYKPHSLKSDVWFHNSNPLQLSKVKILDMKDYGYAEYIIPAKQNTKDDLKKYYYNFGFLTGFFNIIGTTDLISDNVIAGKDSPVFIDLETIFSVDIKEGEKNKKKNNTFDFFRKSIMISGLLTEEITFEANRDSPFFLRHATTKDMSDYVKEVFPKTIIKEKFANIPLNNAKKSKHLPCLNNESTEIRDFIDNYLLGFNNFFTYHKQNINIEIPNLKVRFLFRNTEQYATLLKESNKPYYLKNKKKYTNLFTKSLKSTIKNIAKSEVIQIMNGDIPYFYFYTQQEESLFDSQDNIIKEKLYKTSVKDLINKRLLYATENNSVKNNIILIKDNLDTKISFEKHISNIFNDLLDKNITKENISLIITCLGDFLNNRFIESYQEDTYTFSYMDVSDGKRFFHRLMENSTYNGTSGIAIFFLFAYKITKKSAYFDMFDKIYTNILKVSKNIIHKNKFNEKNLNFYDSPTNGIFLHLIYHKYLNNPLDESFLNDYLIFLNRNLSKDTFLDILTGCASTVNFLIENNNLFESHKVKSICYQYLDLVKKGIILNEDKISWYFRKDLSDNFLGFAHGATGISYTISNIMIFLNDYSEVPLIKKSWEYIKSLYNEGENRWYLSYKTTTLTDPSYNHGSISIMLLIDKLKYILIDEDLKYYANLIFKEILKEFYNRSYIIANGILGNMAIIEYFLKNNHNYIDSQLIEAYNNIKIKMKLKNIFHSTGGFNVFLTYELFSGISGIGYMLPFLFTDTEMPDILTFKI
ncbi:MAG: type 2 lanthipeptide synthetase LanM [Raineya sp.]|jgi:type 2 lantibiotic biosynthesis protein LanM|nr:type 2 lanthipeptide synthetase LanM [Raineya sp.]